MAELLRRNEGERVRLTMHALWAGESDPQEWPQLQGVPWVGRIRDVGEAVQIHNADEVVFSGKDVRTESIVAALPCWGGWGQMPHRLDRCGGRDVQWRGVSVKPLWRFSADCIVQRWRGPKGFLTWCWSFGLGHGAGDVVHRTGRLGPFFDEDSPRKRHLGASWKPASS